MKEIDAGAGGGLHYRELNRRIFEAVQAGEKSIRVTNVNGQRYIGDGLAAGQDVEIEILGTGGNDLGAFMNGLTVRVRGNAQDAIANTMNSGRIFVHGDAGDALFYGMRGGEVHIRGSVGYRVGIHMKEYMNNIPKVVIGGCAGDFFGEYMAGGYLVLLGLDAGPSKPIAGDYIATGMHGGRIFIRGSVRADHLGRETRPFDLDDEDVKIITPLVGTFCREFGLDAKKILSDRFTKLIPVSKRPYGRHYVPGWHTITDRKTVVPGSVDTNSYPAVRNVRDR